MQVHPGARHMIITEIAQINFKPGMEQEFEAGVARALPAFRPAKGRRGPIALN